MLGLRKKPTLEEALEKEQGKPENQGDTPVEQFMGDLKISGRYFVGNPARRDYILRHYDEIELYLGDLEEKDKERAALLREYIELNLKPTFRKPVFNEKEKADFREIARARKEKKKSVWTTYDHRLRRRTEKFIGSVLILSTIPLAFYIGVQFKKNIEKMISPYAQKIYALYYEIDNLNNSRQGK